MELRRVAEWPVGMATTIGENKTHVRYAPGACPAGTGTGGARRRPWGEASHHDPESPPQRGNAGPLRELIDDRLLDALLERSRDEAGGLRLTGEGTVALRILARSGHDHLSRPRSDGSCEVVEGDAEPVVVWDFGGDVIVTAAQVLPERVVGGEDPR